MSYRRLIKWFSPAARAARRKAKLDRDQYLVPLPLGDTILIGFFGVALVVSTILMFFATHRFFQ